MLLIFSSKAASLEDFCVISALILFILVRLLSFSSICLFIVLLICCQFESFWSSFGSFLSFASIFSFCSLNSLIFFSSSETFFSSVVSLFFTDGKLFCKSFCSNLKLSSCELSSFNCFCRFCRCSLICFILSCFSLICFILSCSCCCFFRSSSFNLFCFSSSFSSLACFSSFFCCSSCFILSCISLNPTLGSPGPRLLSLLLFPKL